MRRFAHAKANLALAVTGRRPDGFHTLRSVFVRLALHDDLVAVSDDGGPADRLEVVGDVDRPVEDDLVLRATEALRALAGRELPGLAFRLEKRIPIAAGLAGGSSDAAAALELAMAAWGIDLPPGDRLALALRLGADVPFFAGGHGAALVEGIGDGLRPLPAPSPPAGVVLVTPPARLATATVFSAYDRLPAPPTSADEGVARLAAAMADGLGGDALAALAPELRDANDLWRAAVSVLPLLARLRDGLEATLGRPVLMTGSGSTLLALYPSPNAAEDVATALSGSGEPVLRDARIIATHTYVEVTP